MDGQARSVEMKGMVAGEPAVQAATGRRGRRAPIDMKEVARLFEELPPHAIEAEMSLLGSMLLDPRVIGDTLMVLKGGEEFFKPANGAIYDAMVKLYDRHATVDIVQLNQSLLDGGVLEAVGGAGYLVQLAEAVPSAANAVHYARLVREKSVVRQLITAAGEILHSAYHRADESQSVLEEAEARIFQIAQHADQSQAEPLQALIRQTIEYLEEHEGKVLTGLPTGYSELDEMTGGLQRGDLIILAARPSMGKTALALNIAEQMSLRGEAVAIFSMEMSKQQLVQRMLASKASIDSHRMRRNMLNRDEHRSLMTACDELLDAKLFIDDTPGLSLLQLRAKARRMQQKHGVTAVVIDYLQLMTSGRKVESRQLEVSEISRGVKAMARELNVPVLCLSQLNRSPEMRAGHKPMMSDLRESGSIEQDADVVSMLHREDYYHKDDPEWEVNNPGKAGVAELILAKQRNGPTGVVYLTWVASSMRFKDHAPFRGEGYGARNAGGPAFPGGAYSRGARTGPGTGEAPPFRVREEPQRAEGDSSIEDDLPI